MSRVDLTHADQAQVSEIGIAVGVALRQRRELRQVVVTGKCHGHESYFARYVFAKPLRAFVTVNVPSCCAVTLIQYAVPL